MYRLNILIRKQTIKYLYFDIYYFALVSSNLLLIYVFLFRRILVSFFPFIVFL